MCTFVAMKHNMIICTRNKIHDIMYNSNQEIHFHLKIKLNFLQNYLLVLFIPDGT